MSKALDEARAVLEFAEVAGTDHGHATLRDALAALVAEADGERAQLGELLVQALEATHDLSVYEHSKGWTAEHSASGAEATARKPADAVIGLLAKVEA